MCLNSKSPWYIILPDQLLLLNLSVLVILPQSSRQMARQQSKISSLIFILIFRKLLRHVGYVLFIKIGTLFSSKIYVPTVSEVGYLINLNAPVTPLNIAHHYNTY